MVSQLSLRLLSGSSCASAPTSTGDSKSQTRSTNASTHGYSGDNEEISTKSESKKVPSKIDTGNGSAKTREQRSHPSDPSAKRQKIMARNYAAHTVKLDLNRGDLAYPKIYEIPRLLSNEGVKVDMSHVSLVQASEVSDSPFLVPSHYSSPFETDYWNSLIKCLVSSTKRVYKKTVSSGSETQETLGGDQCTRPNDDAYSSASSISDSEEGDGNANENDREEKPMNSKVKTAVINIGNALNMSNQARLVVMGSAPYSVVHVNAAYSRMTGIPSTTALGQPLHELFLDNEVSASLQSNEHTFSLGSLHSKSIKMNSAKDMPKCVVRVSAVGTDASSVTHFVLEIETMNATDGENQAGVARRHDETIEVVG